MKITTLPRSLRKVKTADLVDTLMFKRKILDQMTGSLYPIFERRDIARIETELKRRAKLGAVVKSGVPSATGDKA